jgi:hypothetical protein
VIGFDSKQSLVRVGSSGTTVKKTMKEFILLLIKNVQK